MWQLINLLLVLLVPFVLGVLALTALLRERLEHFCFWERLALSFAVGWGLNAIVMFLLAFFNIRLIFGNILIAELIAAVVLFSISFRSLSRFLAFEIKAPQNFWYYPILILIGIKVLFVFWSALIKPVIDPDLLSFYSFIARTIFINGAVPVSKILLDEPLLPALSQAWVGIGLHSWNDCLISIGNPVLFLSLLVIFYSALARSFKPLYSLVCTFFLATVPFLVFHSGTAYADLMQAFYYSSATIYLFLFMKGAAGAPDQRERSFSYLAVSALLLGIAVWAKRSGIYYAGIDIAVAFLFIFINRAEQKADWKKIIFSLLVFIVIITPWISYRFFALQPNTRGIASSMTNAPSPFEMEVKNEDILQAVYRNSFLEDNWHVLGILFLSTLLLYPKKAFSSTRIYLLSIIGLQFAGIFFIFACTDMSTTILNETLLNRLMLHFIPVILYFCAEVLIQEVPG